jgi:predicted NBD/HSP70 family sugar kinase
VASSADEPTRSFDTAWVRRANRSAVLRAVDEEPRSVTELTRTLVLSRSTVEGTLRYLDGRGLLERHEAVAEGSGRPPVRYSFRGDCGHALGVHVGEHGVRTRLIDVGRHPDDGMSPPAERSIDLPPGLPRDDRLAVLVAECARLLDGAGLRPEHVDAVVVATPGMVAADGEVLACGVIRDWKGVPLVARLREVFPQGGIQVDNDANLAAYGEARVGGSGRAGDLLYILAGARIGLGIVLDGKVRHGANHRAGESANVAGSPWQRANSWLRQHHHMLASADAPPAEVELERFAGHLADAVADVVHLLDPEHVVIGGELARYRDRFLPRVIDLLAERCRPNRSAPSIATSRFAERAVVVGAASAAAAQARHTIFSELPDRVGHCPATTLGT